MDELTRRGIAQDASLCKHVFFIRVRKLSRHIESLPAADRTLFHAFYATDPDAKSAAASQSLQLGALGFGGNRAPIASPGDWSPPGTDAFTRHT